MKCDELKRKYSDITGPYYGYNEVNEAIAELKAENERLSNALDKEHRETIKYMDELCNAKNEIERLTIDKRNVELMADVAESTIEKLKKKMDDYHLMSDIRRAKIKELNRALWMARKAHAVAMFAYWDSHYRDNPNAVYRNRTIDWLRNRWLLILDAIIKKEKEYK